jgi:hypothetical protein
MSVIRIATLVFLVSAINLVNFSARADGQEDACSETTKFARTACYNSAKEVYHLALGKCENVAEGKQDVCEADAMEEFKSSLEECDEQFAARQEVCEEVGPGPYLPRGIRPFTFVRVPYGNDYFPLKPGTTYTYKSFDSKNEITETGVVQVQNKTRSILGVACRVVQDTVYEGDSQDKKIEDTTDWYAEDSQHNVWYFGEIAQNFNEEGILEDIDGSWTAGVEGAKPGIIMFADPGIHIGKTYRQEFALGEAEDVAKIIEIVNQLPVLPAGVSLPASVKGPYLHTHDFSALEPGVVEDKYYAPGVGVVLVIAPNGTKEVLVKMEQRGCW